MKPANSKDFISILSEEKPPLVLFRYKSEKPSFIKLLDELAKDYPLLNIYDYVMIVYMLWALLFGKYRHCCIC